MIKCTAPVRGHYRETARRNCPVCGNRTSQGTGKDSPRFDHAERVGRLSRSYRTPSGSDLPSQICETVREHFNTDNYLPLAVTRTQWAVGPGFFHTGTIRSHETQFTYVYDCGTARGSKVLEREIDLYLKSINSVWKDRNYTQLDTHPCLFYRLPNLHDCISSLGRYRDLLYDKLGQHFTFSGTPFETEWEMQADKSTHHPSINTVFISHFDTDHIKGLEYLAKVATVEELVIPYTTPEERFLYLCKSTTKRSLRTDSSPNQEYSNFILDFAISPRLAIYTLYEQTDLPQRQTRVIEVSNDGGNEEPSFSKRFHIPQGDSTRKPSATSDGTPVWLFRASTVSGNADELGRELIETLIKQGVIEHVNDLKHRDPLRKILSDRNSVSRIAEAYRKITKRNLNTTSLILHSGPARPEESLAIYHMFRRGEATREHISSFEISSPWETGWLGCGDAPLKPLFNVDRFDTIFWKQKLFTSTFAPPHHGSSHDWNECLLDAFGYPTESAPVCVFSADGLYNHPSTTVIAEANNRGAPTYIVTTDSRSRLTETLVVLAPK